MNIVNGWKYHCQDGEDLWDGSIGQIELHHDYTTFTVIGRCSSLRAHMGKYKNVVWICFPDQEKACTLAHPQDIFWNSEKLGVVLESYTDGITVSRAVQELDEFFEGYL